MGAHCRDWISVAALPAAEAFAIGSWISPGRELFDEATIDSLFLRVPVGGAGLRADAFGSFWRVSSRPVYDELRESGRFERCSMPRRWSGPLSVRASRTLRGRNRAPARRPARWLIRLRMPTRENIARTERGAGRSREAGHADVETLVRKPRVPGAK